MVWISKANQISAPSPRLAESPSRGLSNSPFQSSVAVHVCCEPRVMSIASALFDSLRSTGYPIRVSDPKDVKSTAGSTAAKALRSVMVECGAPEIDCFLKDRLHSAYTAVGEAVMFGQSFLPAAFKNLSDGGYAATLERWVGAPVAVTAGSHDPKENPKVWYGCDPKMIQSVHGDVTRRANLSTQGWSFVFAPPSVFDPVKAKVLQFAGTRAEVQYEAPWLHIKPNDGLDSTARDTVSIVKACMRHHSDLARKASTSAFHSSHPAPPNGLPSPDMDAMSAELVTLGQACLSGQLKNSLKRSYLHAASLCGFAWRGGSAKNARDTCIACLFVAHKCGASMLVRPARLHALEDVVRAYLLTVYPNSKVAKDGQEIVETCKNVLAVEAEVVERLGWRVTTAYGEWVWWSILEAEGGAGELSQPILNAKMIACSGQVCSWQGGR